ncbi:amidohydrolase family protein [Sphingobacterium rhinopitheci]|uniref:amidohydrolase family protein n=1 Tax=Sphingobacterium rhinopitheci TaxID=2781960 RepID=UPI001F52813B|nr:amidohydrolase family protein [Sphingobacterium rhinopitheci]
MMMRYFSAEYIIPVSSYPIKNGVIAIDDDGSICGVYDVLSAPKDVEIEVLDGVLIPGFINTHCHLELSHMKGLIAKETGLVNFIGEVLNNRTPTNPDDVNQAMFAADTLMFNNGIQAVGDHVNSAVSATIKSESKIKYHTFVEIIGFKDEDAVAKIDNAKEIEFYFDSQHSSITPHAPYSCSKAIFKYLKKSTTDNNIISIHNQESEEENKFFRYKTGDFIDFYDRMGLNLDFFKAQARNSIQSYLSYLPLNNKCILVHNTFTSLKDLDFINRMGRDVVMCLCPKANLYIEGTLPKINILSEHLDNIAIGTDSFASNDTLSILDELKVIHAQFKDLDFITTIKWATLNGAKALGLDAELGSLEVGKKPGLVLLKGMTMLKINENVEVERIV